MRMVSSLLYRLKSEEKMKAEKGRRRKAGHPRTINLVSASSLPFNYEKYLKNDVIATDLIKSTFDVQVGCLSLLSFREERAEYRCEYATGHPRRPANGPQLASI